MAADIPREMMHGEVINADAEEQFLAMRMSFSTNPSNERMPLLIAGNRAEFIIRLHMPRCRILCGREAPSVPRGGVEE